MSILPYSIVHQIQSNNTPSDVFIEHCEDFQHIVYRYNFSAQNRRERYKELTDVKRIKVRPPKHGQLYPCLSDIEATTETESEIPDER